MVNHRVVRALIGLVMLLGLLPNPVGRLAYD